LKGDIN